VKWFKGNIHTHTNESDGDSDPKTVVNFFVELNYDFLVLSDHNHLTVLDYGNKHPDILMIPGEEVTIREPFNIHMGAIGINSYVEPIYGNDSIDTIRANTNAIHSAGGIAVLNHPNFKWALNEKIIHKVNELKFFEVFNGDSATNNLGNENSKSTEEIWDYLLSNGKLIFGVATDDSHHYKKFSSLLSNPGRGWIMVKAESRVQADILDNFAKGNFYSSTGVFILKKTLNITIKLNL
jgi:predicted metal-dependent phosphoesterase TrpH